MKYPDIHCSNAKNNKKKKIVLLPLWKYVIYFEAIAILKNSKEKRITINE